MDRINKQAQKCIQITYRNGFISKKIEINMGALVMFGLVSVIAIVGVIYFNDQDKKREMIWEQKTSIWQKALIGF